MKEILNSLFDEKTVSVISEIPGRETISIRDVARKTSLPVATVFRIFQKLEKSGLIKKKRVGVFSCYEIDKNSKAYALTEKLIPKQNPLELLTNIVSKDKTEEIRLLDEGEGRANILVIGQIKTNKVMELCEVIKKEFSFSIQPLVLTREQYDNMARLNIAPSSKKVLFKR